MQAQDIRALHQLVATVLIASLFACGQAQNIGIPPEPSSAAVAERGASSALRGGLSNSIKTYTGKFRDGATYLIEVPKKWNGTLLLWSHAARFPNTSSNPPDDMNLDVGDPDRSHLLSHGFALAGSSYCSGGWVIQCAMHDQIAVLDRFASLVGQPSRTIAWGDSMGGEITAGLIQKYPDRFSGALTDGGVLAGSVGTFNQWLDQAFAINTLIASGRLELVHITNPNKDVTIALKALSDAQSNAEGRARIDLVAALGDSPGWNNLKAPNPPEPGPHDYTRREQYNYASLQNDASVFFWIIRQDFEQLAGGNPSWNTEVDYRKQLERSVDATEVKTLYSRAGISLDADLDLLNATRRIAVDPGALAYAKRNVAYSGKINVPFLTLHTTGDDVVNVQHEQAYAAVIREEGNNSLLRARFVHRSGHLNLTQGELLVGLEALIHRLDSGEWKDMRPEDLNAAASRLGPKFSALIPPYPPGPSAKPAFIEYEPAPFLRRYNVDGDK
jgi:pimeloyl-ACP methyl ester carboxylesterase